MQKPQFMTIYYRKMGDNHRAYMAEFHSGEVAAVEFVSHILSDLNYREFEYSHTIFERTSTDLLKLDFRKRAETAKTEAV